MSTRVRLTDGRFAIVDDTDAPGVLELGAWQHKICDGRSYAAHGFARGSIYLHRLILPGVPIVDHVNGDGLDNRRVNLRPATQSQNNANSRRSSANTSGFKGVSLYRRTGRWRAYLGTRPKEVHLGYFATREEAARAYDRAAIQTWGDYARTNFPREDYAA